MKMPYLILVVISCLSACGSLSTQTEKRVQGELPENWGTETESAMVEPSWWLSFDDPRLTILINEALLENPKLRQADAVAQQALAQAKIAGADRLPQLSAALNSSRQQQSLATVPGANVDSGANSIISEAHGAALNISWEIDLWGRLSSLSAAARADFLASEQNFRAVQQSIAAQTAKAYFAVIEAGQQVALSTRTVTIFTETARQVTNRADAGVVAPTDKLLAITNLETARAGLEQRRDALQRFTRQLETLLGDYPDCSIDTPQQLPPIPALLTTGVPASLLTRRPDLLSAELGLHAAGFREAASRSALLPSISLTGSVGLQSNEFSDLLKGNFSVWSIAGQLVQPIFQGGRLRANVDLAQAQQRAAVEAYADAALNSFAEVESSLASEVFLVGQEAALLRASDASTEAERIASNRYEQGVILFLTVLESQQRALDTRSAYIAARLARLNNRIDLHLALGGGFESNP